MGKSKILIAQLYYKNSFKNSFLNSRKGRVNEQG
jgi:hypothetical protein